MPAKKKLTPMTSMTFRLPVALAEEFRRAYQDPFSPRPKKGDLSLVVERLLREHLKAQAPAPRPANIQEALDAKL